MNTTKQISALKLAQQWFGQHQLPECPADVTVDQVTKAIETALAEQQAQPFTMGDTAFIPKRKDVSQPESQHDVQANA